MEGVQESFTELAQGITDHIMYLEGEDRYGVFSEEMGVKMLEAAAAGALMEFFLR